MSVPGTKAADSAAPRLGLGRIVAFAAGDFGFNLYWQSLSLYLLFFYTDSVGLSAATAGLIYMVASIWDGLVDPAVGVLAGRTRSRWGRYRPYLLFGAPLLALAFALLYFRPPLAGTALIVAVLGAHLVFRSLYAAVNVPYAALTARITQRTDERATISGLRILFSTVAAATVALATQPIARAFTGRIDSPAGFTAAAGVFAIIATAVIFSVFLTTREQATNEGAHSVAGIAESWRGVAGNRAFWTLVLGGGFMIACSTALGKSVLYYFKYALRDEAASRGALALSAASGLIIVPAWMLVSRRLSKRTIWLLSCGIYAAGLIGFGLAPPRSSALMAGFLIYMQVGTLGLAFAYWGMLPDTVEYGQWRTGVRAEGMVFGMALLFQKIALGLGAGLFGLALDAVGYRANVAQSPQTLHGLRLIMVALPLLGVAVCALAMAFNPLRRGVHETIVANLTKLDATGRTGAPDIGGGL
jgi:GPH family glycoside/pentoside/hexuronide:cation symporter